MFINVAPEDWQRPAGEPTGIPLRMDVDTATLDVDAQGSFAGWVWLHGQRRLPDGTTSLSRERVRISALPSDLRITHLGAQVQIKELQQTHRVNAQPQAQPEADTRRWEPGKRIVGVDRKLLAQELVERYTAGESIRGLASSTGRSYGFVHQILTESGVTLRSRGGSLADRQTQQQ